MAKITTIQTDFTAGELNPDLMGRVNSDRYPSGAQTLRNLWVKVTGGAYRRPGLHFIYEAKQTAPVRLIPWVFNRDQAYVLEVGAGYIRLFQSGSLVVNGDGSPYEIVTTITQDQLPNLSYAQSADSMFFAHPDRKPLHLVRKSQLDWTIADVAFTTLPFDEILDSPPGWLKFSANDQIGATIDINLYDSDTGAAYTGTGFASTDVGSYLTIAGGLVKITSFVDKAHVKGELRALIQVTPIVYATTDPSTGVVTPATWPYVAQSQWKRMQPVWTDALGWPGCVALHQQRLLFAGSNAYPQTFWGSGIRDYYNFELGYTDDAAYSYTLDSEQINPITHLFSMNALIALTGACEFIINGSKGVITPSDVNVKIPSNFGANRVRPVRIGTELLFMQRGSRKLLALSYDPDSQTAYDVAELSLIAEHMTDNTPIIDATAQTQPGNNIHLIRDDGAMVTLTMNKQVQLVAWTLDETDGKYIACASVPLSDGTDVSYFAITREIGGQTVQYIEAYDPTMYVDSGVIGQVAADQPPIDTWGSLQHINGKLVDIVADGAVMPQQVVTDNQVVLDRTFRHIEIGLPYTSTLVTLKPEVQSQVGTGQASRMSTVSVIMRFRRTSGCSVNGDVVPFRQFGLNVLDKPTPVYTGDIPWQGIGWENNEYVIEQPQPLPFHILAIIRTLTVNG